MTTQEQKLAEECDRRHCTRESMIRVPIHVADTSQTWCPDCVREEFDVDYSEHRRRQRSLLRYVTPATVTAFLLGVTTMLLVASVMVV
ncbi:hypothetical protein [Halovivax cerinus]|nr:hypothetical protein [Halovivax cerinus]